MIETTLFIWIGIIHEFSKYFLKSNRRYAWIYDDFVNKYLNISHGIFRYFIIPIILYRIWFMSLFYHLHDKDCAALIFTNLISFVIDFIWFTDRFFIKNNLDLFAYYGMVNTCDLLVHIVIIETSNDNLSLILCLVPILLFLLAILLYLRWTIIENDRIERIEKNKELVINYPRILWNDHPLDSYNNMCLFCREEYDNESEYYQRQCGHTGHTKCFESWWKQKKSTKCIYSYCK